MENNKAKSRSEKSICAKSMEFVSNIIKASSFSLANRTLGTTGKPAKDTPSPEWEIAIEEIPAERRLQERQSQANPTYVIKPVEKNIGSTTHVSTQIEPAKDSIDILASKYIQRIKSERFECGLLETAKSAA